MHVTILASVTEEGPHLLLPTEKEIRAAYRNLNPIWLHQVSGNGIHLTSPVGPSTPPRSGGEVPLPPSTPTLYLELKSRPKGACVICWKKGCTYMAGTTPEFSCKGRFHPNNKHRKAECNSCHIWYGPRATPCGAPEPWPRVDL